MNLELEEEEEEVITFVTKFVQGFGLAQHICFVKSDLPIWTS